MNIVAAVALSYFSTAGTAVASAADDAAVLKAAVAHLCSGNYLIVESTSVEPNDPYSHGLPGFPQDALRHVWSRSRTQEILPLSDICPGARFVTPEEVRSAFDAASGTVAKSLEWRWEEGFYKTFPGAWGLIRLSLPGYTRDKSSAVIYLQTGRGSLAGWGGYVLLRKKRGEWIVVKSQDVWVA